MSWAGRFTTVKINTDGVEEAFFTVLLGAALSDGRQDPREEEEISALLNRLMSTEEKDPQRAAEMRGRVRVRIQARGGNGGIDFKVIEEACQVLLRTKLGESVFANAADIIFADRKIVQEEVAYLQTLQGYLGITEARADQIIEIIQVKNRPQDVFS